MLACPPRESQASSTQSFKNFDLKFDNHVLCGATPISRVHRGYRSIWKRAKGGVVGTTDLAVRVSLDGLGVLGEVLQGTGVFQQVYSSIDANSSGQLLALAICCVDRGQTFETSCGSRRRRSAAYWIHHQIVDGDPIRRRTRTSIQAPLVSAMSRRCLGIQAVNCLLQRRRLHPSRS